MGFVLSEDPVLRRGCGFVHPEVLQGIDDDEADSLALSFKEAEAQAKAELLATPEVFADWLAKANEGARSVIDVNDVPRSISADMIYLDVPRVTALWVAGTEDQSRHARYELHSRFFAAHKDVINWRVVDLMAAPL